jgi:hypothetical protein
MVDPNIPSYSPLILSGQNKNIACAPMTSLIIFKTDVNGKNGLTCSSKRMRK